MQSNQKKLLALLDGLDDSTPTTREEIVKAPFGYPGGKSRAISQILPYLPYRNTYVEAFGGTGAVLLSRRESPLEVLNDRYAGIAAFYKCFNDEQTMLRLLNRVNNVVHSRELFQWCKQTWAEVSDDVERAARWYYMLRTSFGQLGRNFGRATSGRGQIGNKIHPELADWYPVHRRLKNVQVENQDWLQCLRDYDSHDTVFYLDPPYFITQAGTYVHGFDEAEHVKLCNEIMLLKGHVVLSGYQNELYSKYPWDDFHSWPQNVSVTTQAFEGTTAGKEGQIERGKAIECIWIKEAV